MAELLFSHPEMWEDGDGNSPPAAWDGTKYHFLVGTFITYNGSVEVGDTFDLHATWTTDITPIASLFCIFDQQGIMDGGPAESASATFTADEPGAPGDYFIEINVSGYSCDITLTSGDQPILACDELGRVTRAYVSGYQRDRVHASRLVRGEKRCLVANFNGAIPAARSIASVTWRCEQTYTVAMANARITGREVAVDITAHLQGCAWVKCVATLDNGEAYTQMFRVGVYAAPWFDGEQSPTTGPAVLTSP